MRLAELEPRWLTNDAGERVGLILLCPCCRKTWLTCGWVETKLRDQFAMQRRALDHKPGAENPPEAVPFKQSAPWRVTAGDNFDNISIHPSLDASASGHWHGFITNGQIV